MSRSRDTRPTKHELTDTTTRTADPSNNIGGEAEEAWFDDWLDNERRLGRIEGPFSQHELEGGAGACRSSPCSVIPKTVPEGAAPKFRLIDNHSFPKKPFKDGTTSVNANLDPSDFPCDWFSLEEVRTGLRDLENPQEHDAFKPQAMGVDIRDASMHVPLTPEARRSMIIRGKDGLYVRRVAAFGARTTPGAFGTLMDATRAFLRHRFGDQVVVVYNQVDDLLIIRRNASVDRDQVVGLLEELGWELSHEKEWPWSRSFTHVGVEFNLDERYVRLPDKKRLKYLAFASMLLEDGELTCEEAEKVAGYLCYVAQIDPKQRIDMEAIYRTRTAINNSSKAPYTLWKNLPTPFRSSLERWVKYLEKPSTLIPLDRPPTTSALELYSDASSRGMGIYVKKDGVEYGEYAPLARRTNEEGAPDIGVAEAAATEWLIDAALAFGARDERLIVNCDNLGVVGAWEKGWSRSRLTHRCFWRIAQKTRDLGLDIEFVYVASADNPADRVSREEEGHLDGLVPFPFELEKPAGAVGGREA